MYARDNAATATHLQQPSAAQVEAAAEFFRMLGDPNRVRLLIELSRGDKDVTSLAEAIGAARPTVSQHLAKLRMVGLVSTRRDGRRAVYRVRGGHTRALINEALSQADHHVRGLDDHD
jgi:DNA-binding transcriptional ArsR family regulator